MARKVVRKLGSRRMVYAMLYAENADIIGTYESEKCAVRDLEEFVNNNPELQREVGLRPYENGLPAGPWLADG